jgi:chromosome segregation ATPase
LPKDDFYTPTDIDALRMENELLAFEVRFLKAQLAETERLKSRLEESERYVAELKSRLEESERSVAELKSRLEESERAEKDLALLLRRLGSSPLGPLFRARTSFRTLEQQYLDTDA